MSAFLIAAPSSRRSLSSFINDESLRFGRIKRAIYELDDQLRAFMEKHRTIIRTAEDAFRMVAILAPGGNSEFNAECIQSLISIFGCYRDWPNIRKKKSQFKYQSLVVLLIGLTKSTELLIEMYLRRKLSPKLLSASTSILASSPLAWQIIFSIELLKCLLRIILFCGMRATAFINSDEETLNERELDELASESCSCGREAKEKKLLMVNHVTPSAHNIKSTQQQLHFNTHFDHLYHENPKGRDNVYHHVVIGHHSGKRLVTLKDMEECGGPDRIIRLVTKEKEDLAWMKWEMSSNQPPCTACKAKAYRKLVISRNNRLNGDSEWGDDKGAGNLSNGGNDAIGLNSNSSALSAIEVPPLLPPSRRVCIPMNQQYMIPIVSELMHIMRPVIHLICIRKFGLATWTPWVISLLVDLMSLSLMIRPDRSRHSLAQMERMSKEKTSRYMKLIFYLARSPCYQRVIREHVLNRLASVPWVGSLISSGNDSLDVLQSYWFYTSASS